MRMSIDEAISKLQFVRNALNGATKIIKAYDLAIDIMCKYKKIEKIMDKRPKDMISSNPTLRAISEVLKDEKPRIYCD